MNILSLMASLTLDTSDYVKETEKVRQQTKTSVSTMAKSYQTLQGKVTQLYEAYSKSAKETGATSKQTKQLKRDLKDATAQLNTTRDALKSAERNMKSLGDSAGIAGGASGFGGFADSLTASITKGNILANVATQLTSVVTDAAKAFVTTGINYNAQMEQYEVALTNMLGSASQAQEAIEAIKDSAGYYDVSTLVEANQYLISAGENAEYAQATISALGDAVAATGGGADELTRMAQNLQQIANVGEAATVDLKQFAYAGIDIYGILADYMGVSVSQIQDMTIGYEDVTGALIKAADESGKYYNAANSQSDTYNGNLTTLKNNVSELAGLMTSDLTTAIGTVIGKVNTLIERATVAFETKGWEGLIGKISKAMAMASDYSLGVYKDASEYDVYDTYTYKQRQSGMGDDTLYSTEDEVKELRKEKLTGGKTNGTSITGNDSGNNSGGSGSGSGGTAKAAKTITETVLSSVTDTLTKTVDGVTTTTTTLTEHIKNSLGQEYDRVTETIKDVSSETVDGLEVTTTTTKKLVDGVQQSLTTVKDSVEAIAPTIEEQIAASMEALGDSYSYAGTEADYQAQKLAYLESVASEAQVKVDKLKDLFNQSAEANGYNSEMTQELAEQLESAQKELDTATDDLTEYRKELDKTAQAQDDVSTAVSKTASALSGLGGVFSDIGDALDSDFISGFGDMFNALSSGIGIVENLVTSLSTLSEALQAVKTAASSVQAAGGIKAVISSALGIGGTAAAGTAAAGGAVAAGGTAVAAAGVVGVAAILTAVEGYLGFKIGEDTAENGFNWKTLLALLSPVSAIATGIGWIWGLIKKKDDAETDATSYKTLDDKQTIPIYDSLAEFAYRQDWLTSTGANSSRTGTLESYSKQQLQTLNDIKKSLNQIASSSGGSVSGSTVISWIDKQLGNNATLKARGV